MEWLPRNSQLKLEISLNPIIKLNSSDYVINYMKITIIDIFEFIKFYDKVKIYKNIFIELLDLQNEFIILN